MEFVLATYLLTLILTFRDLMGCVSFRPNTCGQDGFIACEDGMIWRSKRYENCYRSEYLCDGVVDCTDSSDEKYCPHNYNYGKLGFSYRFIKGNCPDNHVLCKKGSVKSESGRYSDEKCISENQICDGKKHCEDGSDEIYCPYNASTGFNFVFQPEDCPQGLYRCKSFAPSGRKCIKRSMICDDYTDCDDASDENLCPHIFANSSQSMTQHYPPTTRRTQYRYPGIDTTKFPGPWEDINNHPYRSVTYHNPRESSYIVYLVFFFIIAVMLILLIYNHYYKIKVQNIQLANYRNDLQPNLLTTK